MGEGRGANVPARGPRSALSQCQGFARERTNRARAHAFFFGFSFNLTDFIFNVEMFSKVLCLLAILPSFLGSPNPQRLQLDPNVRGNSFGLENFLFQPYENSETVRVVKTKRIRPRIPTIDRGQTYGLENLSAQVYESTRLNTKQRPAEPTAESNRIKENFVVKPETVVDVTKAETSEVVTERIRKRIMMRRRRKRPTNSEANSEVTGNAILKPGRIPVYPQVSKVVIRTKLPEETTTNRASNDQETTEPEPTTIVTEKSTTSTTTTEKPSTINLKTFLKQQTETLSLSELLQTQNLSLADLLRGNKDASAILKARQSIVSTTAAAITRRKQFNRIETDKTETPPKKIEVVEVTTARTSYNGFQPKIPRTKTKTENLEEPQKQVKRPNQNLSSPGSETQNRLSELRLKLRNFQKKTTVVQPEVTSASSVGDETIEPSESKTTETPYLKNRISFKSANNPELSLIFPNKIENQKRPERLSNWTSRLPSIKRFGQDRIKQNETPMRIPLLTQEESSEEVEELQTTTTTTTTTTTPVVEIRKPEPKDELIELLKSGQNADRLQKILQSRNMTIQELLDNREKPPLQMDISTLFSEQKQVSTTPQPTLFDSLPDFDLQETDRYDEPEAEESAPSIARVLPSREPKQYEFPVSERGVSQQNLQPDDPAPDVSHAEDSLWKLSERSMYYGSSYGYAEFPAIQQTEKPKPKLTDDDIILLETIRRSQETNRKFKLNLNDFAQEEEQPEAEDIEKSYIPPAVKSAIIASGVVMGIALFVFIAIFAACGWKQRQIRLKSASGGTLGKKSKRTLTPVSFKDTHSYKKTIDFDDETSESGTSNTSSYLWSTLKNTFTSRASTLKSRLEKEEKLREDKITLRRNESRRKESRYDDRANGGPEEGPTLKKIDRDRNVINTSFNFKRSPSNNNVSHFNECVHGY